MVRISIITAVFNNKETLVRAIDSVLSQDYTEVEYIVVDGASTDGSREVIESYSSRISRFISEPDHGIYDALNKGIRMATGDVIGFLHSDDVLADSTILSQIAEPFKKEDTDAVYGDLEYRKVDGSLLRKWISQPFRTEMLRRGWMPPHPTLYIRKKWYNTHGMFDTRYTIAADYDLMLRFLQIPGFRAVYLPGVKVRMQVGGVSNRSLKNLWKKSMEDLDIIKKHRLGGWRVLFWKNASKLGQWL